jgi:Zn-finger protein
MLPRFLLADNSQESPDTIYVVHTEEPKFIVESDIEDFWSNQEIHWISEAPESPELIKSLLEEAENFLEDEFKNQEKLYDEEEDEEV